jgi:hypothetical protein
MLTRSEYTEGMIAQDITQFAHADTAPILPREAQGALDMWVSLRGGRALPTKADFSPIDWRAWISDISLVEIHEGTPRYFVALHGGRTRQFTGGCLHKKYLDDSLTADTRDLCLMLYRESERTGLPTFSVLSPRLRGGKVYTLWRLALPFTNDTPQDGPASVDRFVIWAGTNSNQPYDFQWLYKCLQANFQEHGTLDGQVNLSVLDV